MGTCLSKKSVCATSSPVAVPHPPEKPKPETQEPSVVKKEIFFIKHRTSHEIERQRSDEEKVEINKPEESVGDDEIGSSGNATSKGNGNGVLGGVTPARHSSCTKEEVDAILIQCGRLSRSSSAALQPESGGRRYSGSKRSYDFDESGKPDGNNGDDERENRRKDRHRHSPGRRRTPSRERDGDQARSGSRERSNGNGGRRRVSRSPGRRSESPITTRPNADPNPNPNSKPGKMVSVPATVPPSSLDPNASVKRIQVKRNATSPRARSPARTRAANEPITLSRSNSRKAENSPYRRNPLSEIDTNIISQVATQKLNAESRTNCSKPDNANCRKTPIEDVKGQTFVISDNVAMNVIPQENPKPQAARSRSSRLSRDLDSIINPDNVSSASSSYTALLLEDIQNFHQKNNTSNPPPAATAAAGFTLPACVTKAQLILEAVADLNSTAEETNKRGDSNKASKIRHHPILESEAVGKEDDLMEPSFHKYVTVRRGADDLEEQQESSGSNSLQQQQWSSFWEPNSAESTDVRTCSSSLSRTVSKQGAAVPESGDGGKKVKAKRRVYSDRHQQSQNGIGRGRIGTRGLHSAAVSMS